VSGADDDQVIGPGIALTGSAHARREGEALAEEIRSLPGRGRPLRLRLFNFRPGSDSYLSALAGPRPYMIRLREIARLTAEHEVQLGDAWKALGATGLDDATFAAAWRARTEAWSFDEVNSLIDRHNRFYPIESRLPMDPRTGSHALVAGKEYRLDPLDATWALDRFPATRDVSES
jgi:hypothetical protein